VEKKRKKKAGNLFSLRKPKGGEGNPIWQRVVMREKEKRKRKRGGETYFIGHSFIRGGGGVEGGRITLNPVHARVREGDFTLPLNSR